MNNPCAQVRCEITAPSGGVDQERGDVDEGGPTCTVLLVVGLTAPLHAVPIDSWNRGSAIHACVLTGDLNL